MFLLKFKVIHRGLLAPNQRIHLEFFLNGKLVAKNRSGRLFNINTWGSKENDQFTPVVQSPSQCRHTPQDFFDPIRDIPPKQHNHHYKIKSTAITNKLSTE